MNNEIAISVIIPFFNAEHNLEKCLTSLLKQTFDKKFEVLMINDCSQDKSINLIKKFNISYLKILSLSKNSGPSIARNKGLDEAQGKYVFFLDADDFIEPETFTELFNKAENNDSDIVFCDKKRLINSINQFKNIFTYSSDINFNYEEITEEIKKRISDHHYSLRVIGCHGKLIKRSIILNNNLNFNKQLRFMEDEIFILDVLGYSVKISYLRKQLYNYNINPTIPTARSDAFNFIFPIENFKIMSTHLKNSLSRRGLNKNETEKFRRQSLIYFIIYTLLSYSLSIFRGKVDCKKGIESRGVIIKEIVKDKEIRDAAKFYLRSKDESFLIPIAIQLGSKILLEIACNLRVKKILKKII